MRLIEPMDAKSAIRVLEMAVTYNGCGRATSDDLAEALKMAKEALEKQIPKKPEIIACDEKKRYHCSCGKTLFIKYTGGGCHGNKAKYCDKCGQAIDWEEGGGGRMTNLEKIKAMSVGEFIGMFGHNGLCDIIQYYFKSHCEAHGVCDNCLWDFLESKVEE